MLWEKKKGGGCWGEEEERNFSLTEALLSVIQFSVLNGAKLRKVTCCWLIFILNVFNQSSKKRYAKYGKCKDLQTYFSEKNIWHSNQVFPGIDFPKFQGNRSVLRNVIVCGYLTAMRYWNIPIFHILWEDF